MTLRLLTDAQRAQAELLLVRHGISLGGCSFIMRSSWDHETTAAQRQLVERYFEERRYSTPDE